MKTKALVCTSWDDIVFQNRNMEYGAYVLRKSYQKNLLVGLMVSTAFMLLIFFSVISNAPSSIPDIRIIKEKVIELLPPPNFAPPVLPPPPAPAVQSHTTQTNAALPPLVTTEVVEETPVTEVPVSSDLPVEGDATGLVSPYTGDQTAASNITTVIAAPKVVNFAEVMPQYKGGMEAMMKFIRKNLKYPAAARRMMLGGVVYVSFVVNGDGSVADVQLTKGFHPDCDREALRVISLLPGWIGGKQNDMPVNVRMVLPIHFRVE